MKNRTPVEKAQANPRSLRLGVNAKCFQCQGENADPSVQYRIGNCEVRGCGLWPLRPYQAMAGNQVPAGLKKTVK